MMSLNDDMLAAPAAMPKTVKKSKHRKRYGWSFTGIYTAFEKIDLSFFIAELPSMIHTDIVFEPWKDNAKKPQKAAF